MRVLAIGIVRDGATDADLAPHLAAERARGAELARAGLIREAYERGDRPGTVMVLEGVDAAAAERDLSTLPLIQAGLTQFTFIPIRPVGGT